jgi:hypothetical protein
MCPSPRAVEPAEGRSEDPPSTAERTGRSFLASVRFLVGVNATVPDDLLRIMRIRCPATVAHPQRAIPGHPGKGTVEQ